jgi:nicotinamide-nucleotide amidase
MKAEIVSVGDELLTGLVVNTNAQWLGEKLVELGIPVRWITTVGDSADEIVSALRLAYRRARIIVLTGGLGPTHDDVTKEALRRFYKTRLIFHPLSMKAIEERFRQREIPLRDIHREQAMVPQGAEIFNNPLGTAPGLFFQRDGRFCFALPGVPMEMRAIVEKEVVPRLRRLRVQTRVRFRILRTLGIPESDLYERLADLLPAFSGIRFSFLPRQSGVSLRLAAEGRTEKSCEEKLDRAEEAVRQRIGETIYSVGETDLEYIVAGLLLEKKKSLAVAESCTGGLIAHKLTNVPGSSAYFLEGVVAYSNAAKKTRLDVPEEILRMHGAVSSETALAMARGVRLKSGADFGLASTGIAGPGGGTPEKPVGLVYFGLDDGARSFTRRHIFGGNREWNKERAALTALNILRTVLETGT